MIATTLYCFECVMPTIVGEQKYFVCEYCESYNLIELEEVK